MTTPDPQTTQLTGVWESPSGARVEVIHEGDRWLSWFYKSPRAIPDTFEHVTEESLRSAIWSLENQGFARNPHRQPSRPEPVKEARNWFDRLFDYRT